MTIRILVVDDSALYRQMVRNVLREVPDVEVVGVASSGAEALEKLSEVNPDLLTLDLQMPNMDGLELLRQMKKQHSRAKALVLSSLTSNGAKATTDALLAGAFDFIHKPSSADASANRATLLQELTEKLEAFRMSLGERLPDHKASLPTAHEDLLTASGVSRGTIPPSATGRRCKEMARFEAVIIGASTGGPAALREVLPKLPPTMDLPIFVVQHMPAHYTSSLAQRLNEDCQMQVVEAHDGMHVEDNCIYIAPGGLHLRLVALRGQVFMQTTQDAPEHNCRPAVDYLLRSAADTYDGRVLAVILTGMGRDGAEGCRALKHKGGYVMAQHPDGCVVYGMPKVVVEEHLVDRVVPLDKISGWIVRQIGSREKAI